MDAYRGSMLRLGDFPMHFVTTSCATRRRSSLLMEMPVSFYRHRERIVSKEFPYSTERNLPAKRHSVLAVLLFLLL